jgi:hypothetical protein
VILENVAADELTPTEATALAGLVECSTLDSVENDARLAALEARLATPQLQGVPQP